LIGDEEDDTKDDDITLFTELLFTGSLLLPCFIPLL